MSDTDSAVQRLTAAQGIMQNSYASAVAQAASNVSTAIQFMMASAEDITHVDGHAQQAVGMSEIHNQLETLNVVNETIIDHLMALETYFGEAAGIGGTVVNTIHDRIQSLMQAGG